MNQEEKIFYREKLQSKKKTLKEKNMADFTPCILSPFPTHSHHTYTKTREELAAKYSLKASTSESLLDVIIKLFNVFYQYVFILILNQISVLRIDSVACCTDCKTL